MILFYNHHFLICFREQSTTMSAPVKKKMRHTEEFFDTSGVRVCQSLNRLHIAMALKEFFNSFSQEILNLPNGVFIVAGNHCDSCNVKIDLIGAVVSIITNYYTRFITTYQFIIAFYIGR